ncbi:hypothetical protein [Methylotenera sp.]|uniref:hypothetical protein n=1 Tax=Methylotenera sp. TaxID=2051956 RepID=UPI002736EE5F|nr:hypothetical protein [Methylotenera sp.]MDP3211473.1 hypothetical protein [Methylotenera sp.]
MAHIPTLEETLVEIYKHLGSKDKALSYKQIERFKNFEKNSLDNFDKTQKKITDEVFNALDIDFNNQDVARLNLAEWAQFNKSLELNVWTVGASSQQVIWHLLAYLHVPHLARRLAFWQLANVEDGKPANDAGMPGGEFWYLPKLNHMQDDLVLPVTTVMDWLLDLLGLNSTYAMERAVRDGKRKVEVLKESAIKTLNNWHKSKELPTLNKIDQYFPDNLTYFFDGAIKLDETLSIDEKLELTREFLTKKGLDSAEKIHEQIPMNEKRIASALNKSAPNEEIEIFINQIQVRYAMPTMKTIRQRLKVARMSQSAYENLLEFLCPNIDKHSADAQQNKLLQLIALFQTVYNLTIEAWNKADSEFTQDAYFESKIAPWDKMDLLISVLPLIPSEVRFRLLAERLTRIFLSKDINSSLDNLVPYGKELNDDVFETIKNRCLLLKNHGDEDKRLQQLIERVRVASPWRALQNENSFWVVSQLSGHYQSNKKLRDICLSRMRELANTESQKVNVNVIEIYFLLDESPKSRQSNLAELVERLLSESEKSTGYNQWKAPLLNARAKHFLFQNDFDSAIIYFKDALDACKERNYGPNRGLYARDLLGLLVFANKLNRKNDEKYYREFLYYSEVSKHISYDQALDECKKYFQETLYQPYF